MLGFYKQHGISPVVQDISDLDRHLQRRGSLYRLLGLPALAFEGRRVLEVGPGSGHNSLFVSSRQPSCYDLVEPNPKAAQDIAALYDGFALAHARPTVHNQTLQDFTTSIPYDIVLCEGWLGNSTHDRHLLKKLASLLRVDGILVMTFVPPVGGLATLFRRLLSLRLLDGVQGFEAQGRILTEAFAPHLATMQAMSRPALDWVQDNLLCPAILGQAQTPSEIMSSLGTGFAILGTVPGFYTEWRWYKSLFGDAKRFNDSFQDDFEALLHNLADYRVAPTRRDGDMNRRLEAATRALFLEVAAQEASGESKPSAAIGDLVLDIQDHLDDCLPAAAQALAEVWEVLSSRNIEPATVANLPHFGTWFGRENCYLSFSREAA